MDVFTLLKLVVECRQNAQSLYKLQIGVHDLIKMRANIVWSSRNHRSLNHVCTSEKKPTNDVKWSE